MTPVRPDGLLGGRVRLFQPEAGYRAAIDPVLLAAAVPAMDGDEVLDVGVGTGAASLCLLARLACIRVTGVDREAGSLDLAARSAEASGMAGRLELVAGDVADLPPSLRARRFQQVMSNPPYYAEGAATPPENGPARSAHSTAMPLAAWIDACRRRLGSGGRLTLIHRADHLPAILAALGRDLGAVAILPLWPRQGEPARRVIVQARQGSRAPARLLPGLVLHEADGRYTATAEAVLRDAAPLAL